METLPILVHLPRFKDLTRALRSSSSTTVSRDSPTLALSWEATLMACIRMMQTLTPTRLTFLSSAEPILPRQATLRCYCSTRFVASRLFRITLRLRSFALSRERSEVSIYVSLSLWDVGRADTDFDPSQPLCAKRTSSTTRTSATSKRCLYTLSVLSWRRGLRRAKLGICSVWRFGWRR